MPLTKVTYSMISGDVVNVLDYGAVGDGVTDDSAAINAALTYANTARKSVFAPAGTYLIKSTIDVSITTLIGEGSWNEVATTGGKTQFLAGTVDMIMLKVGSLGRVENIAVQGNDIANIGIQCSQGPRIDLKDIEIYRCRKGGLVLAQTQNSCFVNVFTQYNAYGLVLSNGARNNNFYNCTGACVAAYYNAAAIGVPHNQTAAIVFMIDTTDPDYGSGGVTTGGQDRNNWFGGIHENYQTGIIAKNLSATPGSQATNNQFYGVEFTNTVIVDSSNGDPGALLFDSTCWIIDDQVSPMTIGTNGYLNFQNVCYFSGGNNVSNRGITIPNNYPKLFVIDTDNSLFALSSSGGGTYSLDNTTKEITVTGGNAVQGVSVGPSGISNIANATTIYTVGKPVGFNAELTFTIKTITGANPVLVYLNLNGSPFRRQIASIASAGTYTVMVRVGENPLDGFTVAFANNNNTSFVVKGVTMRAVGGF